MTRLKTSTAFVAAALMLSGAAFAQTGSGSSSGGSGSVGGTSGSGSMSGQGSNLGAGGTAGSASPGSSPSTLTPPNRAPGLEGSSSGTSPSTTGAVGSGRAAAPSAVQKTPREEELDRKGNQLENKVKKGICNGC